MTTDNPKVAQSQELLKNIPDLEKGLCRINYGSVRPKPAKFGENDNTNNLYSRRLRN